MLKYQNNLTDRSGNAVPNVEVTVTTTGGVLAQLYSDDGVTPKPNPLTTDANGYIEFYAADDRYNITVGGAGGYQDVEIYDVRALDVAAAKKAELSANDGATKVGTPEGTVQQALNARPTTPVLGAPGGSTLVGFSQDALGSAAELDVRSVLRETVSAKRFGAIADGNSHPISEWITSGRFANLADVQTAYPFVTSLTQEIDWAATQAASDYCASTKAALRLQSGTYVFGADSVVLTRVVTDAYQIIGDGCGDAYSITPIAGTTIKTSGVDAFRMETPYPTSAVLIHGIKFLGNEATKTGFLLNFTSVTRQVKNVWLSQVVGTYVGGLVKAYSATAVNLAYLIIDKAYTWGCDKVVFLDNVPATIFVIRDGLFHNCQNYALHLGRGAELSISDTWFESCNPAAIYKTGTFFLKLRLHSVYFENNTPSIPDRTSLLFGTNTDITLTGGTNLPGSFMTDNPFDLGGACYLSNFTSEVITVKGIGGVILTPDTIRPHHKFECQFHVPYSAAVPANSGDWLFGDTIAGNSAATTMAESSMPAYIAREYAPTRSNEICRGALTLAAPYATAGMLCASFVYQSANVNNGLGLNASFTVSGTVVQLNKTFSFPPESQYAPYFCVVSIPLAAGANPESAYIEVRANKWASLASVFSFALAESLPGNVSGAERTITNMLPIQGRTRRVSKTIAAAGNFTFVAQDRAAKQYNVTSELVINGGSGGLQRVASYGITTNGSKTREVSGTVLAPSVTVTPADGAHVDMLNIAVSNGSGSAIVVDFTWRY